LCVACTEADRTATERMEEHAEREIKKREEELRRTKANAEREAERAEKREKLFRKNTEDAQNKYKQDALAAEQKHPAELEEMRRIAQM
jgi:hypothetical protein